MTDRLKGSKPYGKRYGNPRGNRYSPRKGEKKVYSDEKTENEKPEREKVQRRKPESNAGIITAVNSPRYRRITDTFLMNSTPVHTVFRSILQGSDGGFKGRLDDLVIVGELEDEYCSSVLSIAPDRKWRVHSKDSDSLDKLLNSIAPSRIEGEASVIRNALKHPLYAGLGEPVVKEYFHMELSQRKIPHPSSGHNRFAHPADIPRLNEYARAFLEETSDNPPTDWNNLISENRILIALVEGTIACIAMRSAETIDRVFFEGVYTFKPFRKRGLAKRLIAAISRQASVREKRTATIVRTHNRPMIALLESLGFAKTADYIIAEFPEKTES